MAAVKLNELFYSIQGEGANTGRAALFLRLPFCNLSCSWCDTEFDTFSLHDADALGQLFDDCPTRFAVITGGEPSMNKDAPVLIAMLKARHYEIAMETNGQFPAPAGVDHLTISPKRWTTKTGEPGTQPPFWFHADNQPSEIKLVFDAQMTEATPDDLHARWERGEFKFKAGHPPRFYLSPEWNARDTVMERITQYVCEHPQWRISLQTHKFMKVR